MVRKARKPRAITMRPSIGKPDIERAADALAPIVLEYVRQRAPAPKPRRRHVGHEPTLRGAGHPPYRVAFDVPFRRGRLIEILDGLPAGAMELRVLLSKIIEELPPRADPRVNVTVWHLAALVDAARKQRRGVRVKQIVQAVIDTFAPSHSDDAKFTETVNTHSRKFRRGLMPDTVPLLPVSTDDPAVTMLVANLPIRKSGNRKS